MPQPGALDEADGRPAERHQPAFHLELAEAGALFGDDDIRRQHQLDADGEADALDRRDDRLAPVRRAQVERVDQIAREEVGLRDVERTQLQAGGEMVARSVQHGAAQVVGLVVGIGARQFPAHFRREAVVFCRPIDADQEQVGRAVR